MTAVERGAAVDGPNVALSNKKEATFHGQDVSDVVARADRLQTIMQGRVDRQRAIIEGQKKEILRLRSLLDQCGVSWREGLGL